MSSIQKHPYHLVDPSPWPLVSAVSCLVTAIGAAMFMHAFRNGTAILFLGLPMVICSMFVWWRDVIREATFSGYHTKTVQIGLRSGMILFIASEVMFPFAFFWAFFHASLSPAIEIGSIWPPSTINTFDPWGVPLLNTFILLLSGATVTWAHHEILAGRKEPAKIGSLLTLVLALTSTGFQVFEYIEASFNISDGVYGATFHLATGFHGFHVIIGTIFLTVCFLRLSKNHFTKKHHSGFEAAAWYWHFVDGVGDKQVHNRLFDYVQTPFKRRVFNFERFPGSTLRRIISFVSQDLLLEQKSNAAIRVSSNHVFTKSLLNGSAKPTYSTRFTCERTARETMWNMAFRNVGTPTSFFDKPRGYNNQKTTGNMYGYLSIRTSGKSKKVSVLGTVAETRKYFSSMSGEKDNGSALKNSIPNNNRDKSEKEYIKFIKNDVSLFERAVSPDSLKRAWYQLKSKPGMLTKGSEPQTVPLSGISDSWFKTTSAKSLDGSFVSPRVSIPKQSGGPPPSTGTGTTSGSSWNKTPAAANCRIKVMIIERAIRNAPEPQFEGLSTLKEIDPDPDPDPSGHVGTPQDKNNHVGTKVICNVSPWNKEPAYFKKILIRDKIFFPHSYGFRPNKSAHECLNNIRLWRNNVIFFLDYHIAHKAFDHVNRKRLKNISSNYVIDKRFWNTIDKMLSAGIEEDLNEGEADACRNRLSPFLLNVYLHELDKFIVNLQTKATATNKEYVSGLYGNPEAEQNYRKISRDFAMDRWKTTLKKCSSNSVENLIQARRQIYKEHHDKYGRRKGVDLEVRHIQYVRYADVFLIGIVGSRSYAEQVRRDINGFAKGNLHLEVKKDNPVHRNNGQVKFLEHVIRLQEFKKSNTCSNNNSQAVRAAKQQKIKTLARFALVDKRLARAKTNQYRANILKQINAICTQFNISASKTNMGNISKIVALREVCEQVAPLAGISDPHEFTRMLMDVPIKISKSNSNPALYRWTKLFQKEADKHLEFACRIQTDMLRKTTKEWWEEKTSESEADKLKAIQEEYIVKTQKVVEKKSENERKSALYNAPPGGREREREQSGDNKKLLNLAQGLSPAREVPEREVFRRISINAPIKDTAQRLRLAGFLHPFKSKASGNAKPNSPRDDEIVRKYNSVIYGPPNWYSGAGNFIKIRGYGMLLRKSCALTLSNKHKKSIHWVYDTYGSEIVVEIPFKGPERSVSLITRHQISNFKMGFNLKLEQDPKTLWKQIATFYGASTALAPAPGSTSCSKS